MQNVTVVRRPRGRLLLALLALTLITGGAIMRGRANAAAAYRPAFDELPVSPRRWQARGGQFEHAGYRVFYVDAGAGDPVVLLHGYPTSSWDWRALWPGLLRGHRLVAPDLLGFGFSDKPPDYPYSVSHHADMVTALLASRGITSAKLVAHDVGVSVVQELLARAQAGTLPFTIESVVFLNGTLFVSEYHPRLIQRLLVGPAGPIVNALASERTLTANLRAITGPNDGLSDTDLSAYWYLLNYPGNARLAHRLLVRDRAANDRRWTDALCATTVPMRFVLGPADPSSGMGMAESLRARCTGRPLDVVAIDGAGHFPHLEKPGETLHAITSWRAGGY